MQISRLELPATVTGLPKKLRPPTTAVAKPNLAIIPSSLPQTQFAQKMIVMSEEIVGRALGE